jgi:hypothetical protein
MWARRGISNLLTWNKIFDYERPHQVCLVPEQMLLVLKPHEFRKITTCLASFLATNNPILLDSFMARLSFVSWPSSVIQQLFNLSFEETNTMPAYRSQFEWMRQRARTVGRVTQNSLTGNVFLSHFQYSRLSSYLRCSLIAHEIKQVLQSLIRNWMLSYETIWQIAKVTIQWCQQTTKLTWRI